MDRKDAQKNLDKIKTFKHIDVRANKHICKILEYVLYELDKMKDRETEAPSIYYPSTADEPFYEDYPSEPDINLPDIKEPEPEEYVDDRNIPLVLAYNASLAPFRNDEGEDGEEKEEETEDKEDDQEGGEVRKEEPRDSGPSEVDGSNNSKPDISTPKKIKVIGEKDTNDLHKEGLKRMKDRLRSIKKKKSKKR